MATIKHEHTHLTSSDPDATVDFYTRVMGARVTREMQSGGRRMVDLDLGGVPVRVSGSTGADNVWTGPRFGLHHLGLEVDNLDEFAARLEASGVEFVVKPTQPQPGVKIAFIKGPDNVLFELIEKSSR